MSCIYKYKGKNYTKDEFYSLVSSSNFIQQKQARKFAELQERLNNKEFLKGAKNAFESSKGLQEWGTQEQYNDYIARVSLGIIKNPSSGEYNYYSKVKDIVYHGTNAKFEIFDKEKVSLRGEGGWITDFEGFHFATDITTAESEAFNQGFGNKLILSVLLNIANKKITIDSPHASMSMEYWDSEIRRAKQEKFDSLQYINTVEGDDINYVVFEPEQIHILGSKQDIEGFKKFVEQPIIEEIKEIKPEGLPSIDRTNKTCK